MNNAGRAMELAELLRHERLQLEALQATTARIRQVMKMIREDLSEEPAALDATVLLPVPDLDRTRTIRFPQVAD